MDTNPPVELVSYSPPEAATFISRIAAEPCCAAITAPQHIEPALASRTPVIFILRGNGLTLVPLPTQRG